MEPTEQALQYFYNFVKGNERTAFQLLRSTQDMAMPFTAPLIKPFIGNVDLEKPIPKNKIANKKAEAAFEATAKKGYIENQNTPACKAIKLGITDLTWAGCGIIATYNLLVALGKKKSISDLIEHYEKGSILVKGEFGTDPFMIAEYFKKLGFKTCELKATDKSRPNYVIATFWNDRNNIRNCAHTIALTREADGLLHSHNNGDKEGYATMADFFAKHPKASAIMVLKVEK